MDILPYLLLPLAGPEELSEEEMEGLPEDLQYLGDDKMREDDPDIRKMLIESVMQVCVCITSQQKHIGLGSSVAYCQHDITVLLVR